MILVTGATGFFGINQVKELLAKGKEVLALDLDDFPASTQSFFTREEREHLTFISCDLRNPDAVKTVFKRYPIKRVIHAGAVTVLENEDERKARLVMEVNAGGTFNLLETSIGAGVKRFIYVSSSGVYGTRGGGVVPLHETTPYDPMGLYVAAKIYSELLCRRFNEFGHFRVAVARIGSPYGPWERPTGTRHTMSMIYSMLRMGFTGEEVRIYGADSVRDWTHMRDIVRGTTALMLCSDERLRYLIYNVTTGQNVSTGRIAERIAQVTPNFTYRFVDYAEEANIVAHLPNPRGPLDITRLRENCSYKPLFDIEAGLADYAEWFKMYGTM